VGFVWQTIELAFVLKIWINWFVWQGDWIGFCEAGWLNWFLCGCVIELVSVRRGDWIGCCVPGWLNHYGSRLLRVAAACSIHRHIPTISAGWSRPRAPSPTDRFPRLRRARAGTALLVCRQPHCSGRRQGAAVPQIFWHVHVLVPVHFVWPWKSREPSVTLTSHREHWRLLIRVSGITWRGSKLLEKLSFIRVT
jgi:hypothetical protein